MPPVAYLVATTRTVPRAMGSMPLSTGAFAIVIPPVSATYLTLAIGHVAQGADASGSRAVFSVEGGSTED